MSAGDWKSMLKAIQLSHYDDVKYFLDEGLDPNYEHPELFSTPIIEAIKAGDLEVLKLLIAYGADPSRKSSYEGLNAYEFIEKTNKTHLLNAMPRKARGLIYSLKKLIF